MWSSHYKEKENNIHKFYPRIDHIAVTEHVLKIDQLIASSCTVSRFTWTCSHLVTRDILGKRSPTSSTIHRSWIAIAPMCSLYEEVPILGASCCFPEDQEPRSVLDIRSRWTRYRTGKSPEFCYPVVDSIVATSYHLFRQRDNGKSRTFLQSRSKCVLSGFGNWKNSGSIFLRSGSFITKDHERIRKK